MFSQKSREYFLPYRSADRTIRRRSDRNYAVCVAREGGRGIGCWREKMTRSRVVFTRPGLVIVVRQMFQLAVYAAIVVLTRHKIPIVSRGGEKREGGREAFRGLPCVTLIHRAFQHQAELVGREGKGGDVEFPRSLAGIYSSGVFTVNARCCYMCHERVTFCFLAGEK